MVVDSSGQVLFKSGDSAYITCARSVLKPFQAAAVLKSGAVDGCSAPTPFLSLRMIASLYQRLAGGEDPELERLFKAMTAHPYLIGGRHRFDTAFITALGGRAVTKIGGEGIRGVALRRPNGETLGMALKVLDGNQRCSPLATTTVLNHLDLLSQEETNQLSAFQVRERHNHRNILVGRIRATLEP